MTVDRATWVRRPDGLYIEFRVQDPAVAEQLCRQMEDGKPRELTVKNKRRSLDANAYAWVLMDKLAAKLRIAPEEVYRQYIHDIAGNSDFTLVRDDRLEAWHDAWCRGHIGRMTEDMGPSRVADGYHTVKVYYGSSDFDTSQMARLIDLVVEDCKAQGIETMTERELSLLKEEWT